MEHLLGDIPALGLVVATGTVLDTDIECVLVAGVRLGEHHPQHHVGVTHLDKEFNFDTEDISPSGPLSSS